MKKWHMEGIINGANNLQRRVVFGERNQIFLCAGGSSQELRRIPTLMGCLRFLAARKSRRN